MNTYTHHTRSRNRGHKSTPLFLAPVSGTVRVSCKSGTGFNWY